MNRKLVALIFFFSWAAQSQSADLVSGLNTVTPGIYTDESNSTHCAIQVSRDDKNNRLELSLTTSPKTYVFCAYEGKKLPSLLCERDICVADSFYKITTDQTLQTITLMKLDQRPSALYEHLTLQYAIESYNEIKTWVGSEFFGWSWPYNEATTAVCKMKNGDSKKCVDLKEKNIKKEFPPETALAKVQQEAIRKCLGAGYTDCKIVQNLSTTSVKQSLYDDFQSGAVVRTGYSIQVIVKAN